MALKFAVSSHGSILKADNIAQASGVFSSNQCLSHQDYVLGDAGFRIVPSCDDVFGVRTKRDLPI